MRIRFRLSICGLRSLTVVPLLAAGLLVAGCKPAEPSPPPTPSAPPLAKADTAPPRATKPASGELPAGHPPINPPVATAPPAGSSDLPPGHPPIDRPTAAPAAGSNGLPPGHPPIAKPGSAGGEKPPAESNAGAGGMPAMPAAVPSKLNFIEAKTLLAGISLTPPDGWKAFDAGSGSMAPVAAFLLEGGEGDASNAAVRVTHFPGMRNMGLDMQFDRWYGMVTQPDGKPTSEVAKRETFEAGGATITMTDLAGTIGGAPDQRMIVAVIEHPQGPHFLKAQGPAKTIEKWHDSIMDYLHSAKVAP